MKKVFITTALTIITTTAFGAASLRTPQISGGANTQNISGAVSARAGTLRAQTVKATSTPTSSISKPVPSESTDARLSFLSSKLGKLNVKNTDAAKQELRTINSQIEELQAQLDRAEAAQSTVLTTTNVDDKITASVESKTYTKAEIDDLLSNVIKKLPQLDDRGNMTWTDPNGNLVVVHVGDVVIGGDDIIIVDGNLSTTSTHPVQNKVVTNALNEKQDQSTTLSFGNADGGWSPVDNDNDYIQLYTNTSNAKGFRIKPNMIVNNLDNIANENQLVTATAVKNALDTMTTNPGGGTQPEYILEDLLTLYDGLVKQYIYQTAPNTSHAEMLAFASELCGGTFSEKWCWFEQINENHFSIIRRNIGYYLASYDISAIPDFPSQGVTSYYVVRGYKLNIPDDTWLLTYAENNFCTNRDECYISDVYDYQGSGYLNSDLNPLYYVTVISNLTRFTELPEEYKEENQQTQNH